MHGNTIITRKSQEHLSNLPKIRKSKLTETCNTVPVLFTFTQLILLSDLVTNYRINARQIIVENRYSFPSSPNFTLSQGEA